MLDDIAARMRHLIALLDASMRKRIIRLRPGWKLGSAPDNSGLHAEALASNIYTIEKKSYYFTTLKTGFFRTRRYQIAEARRHRTQMLMR
jgi:hypothetical protein